MDQQHWDKALQKINAAKTHPAFLRRMAKLIFKESGNVGAAQRLNVISICLEKTHKP